MQVIAGIVPHAFTWLDAKSNYRCSVAVAVVVVVVVVVVVCYCRDCCCWCCSCCMICTALMASVVIE